MRFQSKILLSVFCLVLMGFVFMMAQESAYAQLGCCTNDGANQCRPNSGVVACGTGAGTTCQVTQAQCQDPALPGANPDNLWTEGSTCVITGNNRQCPQGNCCQPVGCCAVADPESCAEGITEAACAEVPGFVDGDWSAGSQICEDLQCVFPPVVTTNVPTIGQWGMIAMAGLLGIFSLLIIMRRQRYNID